MYCLAELAEKLDLEFSGDGNCPVTGVASLVSAGPADLSFISDKKFTAQLVDTGAAVVILSPELVQQCPVACLISQTPYLSYARASGLFAKEPGDIQGIHASAVVSPGADIHPTAAIGPNAVIEAGAVIGADVVVAAGVFIGHGSRVGAGTRIYPNAVIYHDVHLGEHCVVHSQTVLGADGFGFAPGPEGWVKIYQLGGVRIGDRVEIGASTTVDRGTLDHTVIEDGAIIDNLVQIAHNCRIGKNTAIAGCAGLAGSTIIGDNCTLSGGVGVVGHLEICDNVHITGMSMVTKSINKPGSYSSGTPLSATRDWKRNAVRFSQLESIQKRLAGLEKKRGS
ncbi:MAG: UDP-3-O-(3-hydroxymyristoyl)glucosamine N-acyltransferase [Proteobacteria bacterium]|nr:UDP-3-O-(3-hydroxymyristoyl)glucosamine N-acyltransferase [Pseudomonadota bacterium]